MRALLLTDHGLKLEHHYPAPTPCAGEALVRIRLAGICATDLELLKGYKGGYRGILGHEFIGEVVQAPGTPEWEGRRVVADINVGCGRCERCRNGHGNHCGSRSSLGIIGNRGAFAELIVLPIANLYEVPTSLSDRQAVFAEPVAAALQPLRQVHIGPQSRVILVGPGKLGVLIAQALAATGCDLTIVGRSDSSLEFVRGLGLHQAVSHDSTAYQALPKGSADVVIEATGSADGYRIARELVMPRGTIVLKSTYAKRVDFDISSLVVDEITLVGSRCGPMDAALRSLVQGHIVVDRMVDAEYDLDQAEVAFEHAAQPGVLKVLLNMESQG